MRSRAERSTGARPPRAESSDSARLAPTGPFSDVRCARLASAVRHFLAASRGGRYGRPFLYSTSSGCNFDCLGGFLRLLSQRHLAQEDADDQGYHRDQRSQQEEVVQRAGQRDPGGLVRKVVGEDRAEYRRDDRAEEDKQER